MNDLEIPLPRLVRNKFPSRVPYFEKGRGEFTQLLINISIKTIYLLKENNRNQDAITLTQVMNELTTNNIIPMTIILLIREFQINTKNAILKYRLDNNCNKNQIIDFIANYWYNIPNIIEYKDDPMDID